jgi:hypothetical protein
MLLKKKNPQTVSNLVLCMPLGKIDAKKQQPKNVISP